MGLTQKTMIICFQIVLQIMQNKAFPVLSIIYRTTYIGWIIEFRHNWRLILTVLTPAPDQMTHRLFELELLIILTVRTTMIIIDFS